jgi:anti-sigma B factor antagonist
VEVTTRIVGTVTVVALAGELDSSAAPGVQDRLRSIVTADDRILVDLSGVPYMSSAGLRTMLLLYRQAQSVNTAVALVGLSAELRAMMGATGFLGFFAVDDTVADGVRGLEDAERGAAS